MVPLSWISDEARNLAHEHAQVVPISLFVAVLCLCLVIGYLLEENRWVNESIVAIIVVSCILSWFWILIMMFVGFSFSPSPLSTMHVYFLIEQEKLKDTLCRIRYYMISFMVNGLFGRVRTECVCMSRKLISDNEYEHVNI